MDWRHQKSISKFTTQNWSGRISINNYKLTHTHKVIIHKYMNANRVIWIYISQVIGNEILSEILLWNCAWKYVNFTLCIQRHAGGRGQLKCDGKRAENRFRLSAKRTSQFKSAGASIQSVTGSRGVRISGSNAGYTMFRGSVKGTGYPLHSPVYPSRPLPWVTVYHHVSTWVYIP